MNIFEYAVITVNEIEKALGTTGIRGMTKQAVTSWHAQHGTYAQDSRRKSFWFSLLIRQIRSPFIYLLVGAGIFSFFLDSKMNGIIIFCIIAINTLVSFFQEYRASRTLELLEQHLHVHAQVIRGGELTSIEARDLVPGDVVLIKAGDFIPADIRFIEGEEIRVDESVLTGESVPVTKQTTPLLQEPHDIPSALNLGFAGTLMISGSGKAIVLSVGKDTAVGGIEQLTTSIARESGFQENIFLLSKLILVLIGITLGTVFIFHLIFKGIPSDVVHLMLFFVALAIGITPEALPAITSFALANGARLLAKHDVIVKRLSAIEDLGSITVLCTDKTGTLTENVLTVHDSYSPQKMACLYACLATKPDPLGHDHKYKDPFDLALLTSLTPEEKQEYEKYTQVRYIHFDPNSKRNRALVKTPEGDYLLITRGVIEEVERVCGPISDQDKMHAWVAQEEAAAYRVIVIAYKRLDREPENIIDQEFEFSCAGAISFHDPIKSTAAQALEQARSMGISVKILTGDSKEVATVIARQLHLADEGKIITGAEFDQLSVEEKRRVSLEYTIFARIAPQQKYEIVSYIREKERVGFLGEGINDAPALRAAHVGIAVQSSTDVAKEAADIVLLRPSLLSIIQGVAIGRKVFFNTVTYIRTSLAANMGNFYSVAIASLFIPYLPMLPKQILTANLLSDFPLIAIASDRVDLSELRRVQMYDLKSLAFIAVVLGLVNSCFDFMLFAIFYKNSPAVLQTMWFISTILTEIALVISMRTRRPFYQGTRPSYALLLFMIIACAVAIILPYTVLGHTIFGFVRPRRWHLFIIGLITIGYFIATELVKVVYYRMTSVKESAHE